MVFKHNKLSFDHDDTITCQLAFQHIRQLTVGSQFPTSAHRRISGKQNFLDGVKSGGNEEVETMAAVIFNNSSRSACDNVDETVRSENNKRPVDVQENLQVAAKRPRQMDGNFFLLSSTCEESFTSLADDKFKRRNDAAVAESSDDSHGNSSGFPWYSCHKSEEERHLSFYPGYYKDHHGPAQYYRAEEFPSRVFSYVFRKPVAIGPDHQAEIPLWRPNFFQNCCGSNCPDALIASEDNPVVEDSSKIECQCFDEGSVRCVRRHVMEAREQLRRSLGHKRFLELGLCDMGEDVALGWSEEEEELFDEVVASNPASARKNFWHCLSRAFPSRSSKELVSYYFNVFMLRKRAEQNRSDPLNVDSDNDEWQQETEEEEDEDEDEDSGLESPTDYVEVNVHEDGDARGDECDGEEEYSLDGYDLADSKSKCNIGDILDDSCTSYEGHNKVHDALDNGNLLHAECGNDGISSMSGHDFFVGHCDLKPWDFSYIGGLDKELDLLPTCVIEEAFRTESWEKS